MKRFLLTLALSLPLATSFAAADTGLNLFSIAAPHHGRNMDMAVMYPSQSGTARPFGENAVFYGVPVHDYAEVVPGKYPVIVLSHGWGGNFARLGWLSSGLAEKGAIIIAVNHPNSTTGELNNLEALNHWTRAQDLKAALDYVMKDPTLAPYIDTSRIYAAGFSYGGWTALSLGGLRGSHAGISKLCSEGETKSTHCADILRAGIKIEDIDVAKWESSYKDPRIAAVAAIDPALTFGLKTTDTTALNVPVLMIGLGEGKSRLYATDTSATGSNFEILIPKANTEVLTPATHFSALGLCKPKGAAILVDEKDDPVCTDPQGSDRKKITRRIIDLIAQHFAL